MLRRRFLSLACFSPIVAILGNTNLSNTNLGNAKTKNNNRYIDVKKNPLS